jgi:DNA repair exonuclease SbcCD ATPase subunit
LKWLNNIFGGKKAGEEAASLQIAGIDSWLEEKQSDSDFQERLAEIYRHMEDASEALSRNISALASAETDAATPPKLLRAGLAARGEVVKQLQSLCEKMVPPRKKDLDSSFQHHWTLVKGLERTATTFARAQRYVAALFPKNIESINSDLAQISRLLVDLESEIGKKRKVQEESWYCRELASSLQVALSSIGDLKKKALEDEETLSGQKSRLSGLEESLKRLEASDEGKKAQDLKRSLERKREEKAASEEQLANLIAPLSKALARIMKQGSSERINLQHKDVFMQLLESPSLVEDRDIAGALKELRSHLTSLGLKDKKKEKILDHIDLLIKRGSLEEARSRQASLEKEISDLQSQLAESSREGLRLKEEASQARKSIRSLEASLEQAKKDLASWEEKAASNESELSMRLARIAGRQVLLDLSSERQ